MSWRSPTGFRGSRGAPGGFCLTQAPGAEAGVGAGRWPGLVPLQDVLHQLLQGQPGGSPPVPAAPLHPVDCGKGGKIPQERSRAAHPLSGPPKEPRALPHPTPSCGKATTTFLSKKVWGVLLEPPKQPHAAPILVHPTGKGRQNPTGVSGGIPHTPSPTLSCRLPERAQQICQKERIWGVSPFPPKRHDPWGETPEGKARGRPPLAHTWGAAGPPAPPGTT